MKLSQIIEPQRIIPDLKATDKKGVLEELAGVVAAGNPLIDKSVLVNVLLEREKLGSTGIGDGVAIPHGKLNGVKEPIISFGRSRKGLDFDSMDDQPVHIFFLLIAPENSAGIHLKVLAKIAKLLKNTNFRKKLMEAGTKEELYEIIIHGDDEL